MSDGKGFGFCLVLFASTLVLIPVNQTSGNNKSTLPLAEEAQRRAVHIPVNDFSLTDQNGKPFRFGTLRGKVIVLSFIYTSCPDVCPLITSSLRMVQGKLSPVERQSVFLLSVTTDPEVDTPKVLKSYAERYKVDFSNWGFLSGDIQALAAVWENFGVKVERKARGLVDHTSLTAVIDGKGTMRFAYTGTSPNHKGVLQEVRSLLVRR